MNNNMASGASAFASSPPSCSPNSGDDNNSDNDNFSWSSVLPDQGSSTPTGHVPLSSSPLLIDTLSVAVSTQSTIPASTALSTVPTVTPTAAGPIFLTMAGWIAWIFSFFFYVIPSVLYRTITFTSITLPTWLFTLFSMSLTFTMNFTTL